MSIDYDNLSVTSVDFGPLSEYLATPQAGMHVVAIAHGVGCTFNAPSGWTQKASVSIGSYLNTRVFTIVNPAASWDIDLDFTSNATRDGIWDTAQASLVELFHFSPTNGTLQVASATSAASDTHAPADCDPSWASPWQSWSILGTPTTIAFQSFSYDEQMSYVFSVANPVSGPADHRHTVRANAPELGGGYGPLAESAVLGELNDVSVDWISLALGWA